MYFVIQRIKNQSNIKRNCYMKNIITASVILFVLVISSVTSAKDVYVNSFGEIDEYVIEESIHTWNNHYDSPLPKYDFIAKTKCVDRKTGKLSGQPLTYLFRMKARSADYSRGYIEGKESELFGLTSWRSIEEDKRAQNVLKIIQKWWLEQQR